MGGFKDPVHLRGEGTCQRPFPPASEKVDIVCYLYVCGRFMPLFLAI